MRTLTDDHADQRVGLAIALACGVILGSAVTVSRYAYDAGASGIVVALCRSCVMIAVMYAGLRYAGRDLWLPRGLRRLAIVNGILMGAMTYGNIGAVEYIPIGLAALLFFTFPIVIAVLVLILRLERVTAAKLLSIVLAFVGLGVMLGVSFGSMDGRGAALALMGSVATAVNAILVGRYFRGTDVFVVTMHFSVVGLVFLILVAVFAADVRLPDSAGGWAGVLGVAGFQAIGTPLYFFAIGRIGALKTGMATNIQPVTSIGEAWVLFGEVLTALQAVGGALVLLSIGLMQWVDFRSQHRAAALGRKP